MDRQAAAAMKNGDPSALAALKARGMIESPTETAANIVRYRSSQLWARLVEHAALKRDPRFVGKKGEPAVRLSEANSYRAVEEEEARKLAEKIAKRQKPNPPGVVKASARVAIVVPDPLARDPGATATVPAL